MKALDLVERLDEETLEEIEGILDNRPEPVQDFRD
jgi:hypothetical protein